MADYSSHFLSPTSAQLSSEWGWGSPSVVPTTPGLTNADTLSVTGSGVTASGPATSQAGPGDQDYYFVDDARGADGSLAFHLSHGIFGSGEIRAEVRVSKPTGKVYKVFSGDSSTDAGKLYPTVSDGGDRPGVGNTSVKYRVFSDDPGLERVPMRDVYLSSVGFPSRLAALVSQEPQGRLTQRSLYTLNPLDHSGVSNSFVSKDSETEYRIDDVRGVVEWVTQGGKQKKSPIISFTLFMTDEDPYGLEEIE